MPSPAARIVILGTGGTIAGQAARADDAVGYTAGAIGVQTLIDAVPPLRAVELEAEQVAQLDSKDMDAATWQRLAQRAAHHLARPEVQGLVVTHGTDTLEETAWFLHRVLAPAKPVVLTAAMRPATALSADGPQNLLDAVTVARHPGAAGVVAVLAGRVHAAADLRKRHATRLDAFSGGDAGPVALVEDGRLRVLRAWPSGQALGLPAIARDPAAWPWVTVLANHAGANGREVRALLDAGVRGMVVAGTGNGSLSAPLEAALVAAARDAGVPVLRCSRCADGSVIDPPDAALPSAGDRSPWQARVDLLLDLLAQP
ncbi:MAG: asparaginase [Burkholderiaceae bacterium]|nr:asparaginase [Burkholderiaceae bacterium]